MQGRGCTGVGDVEEEERRWGGGPWTAPCHGGEEEYGVVSHALEEPVSPRGRKSLDWAL